jgi:hypothetical protein
MEKAQKKEISLLYERNEEEKKKSLTHAFCLCR